MKLLEINQNHKKNSNFINVHVPFEIGEISDKSKDITSKQVWVV